jgi:hypothetical protein
MRRLDRLGVRRWISHRGGKDIVEVNGIEGKNKYWTMSHEFPVSNLLACIEAKKSAAFAPHACLIYLSISQSKEFEFC